MKIETLKDSLQINKNALDDEVIRQPQLFFAVAEKYVEAAAKRDTLKEALTSIDAELDGKVRIMLEKAAEKTTEAIVRNAVQVHKDHEKAFNLYIQAKIDADALGALKEAFIQRSFMLRDMCSLYVSSYYENASIQANSASDKAVYKEKRTRMADARGARS